MVQLLVSQNELWLKSIFKNPADFSIVSWYNLYHDTMEKSAGFLNIISWYFLTKFLELQFLILTVANKMCSWNIDAPDASATTSNLNHLMHISLPTGILKYINVQIVCLSS